MLASIVQRANIYTKQALTGTGTSVTFGPFQAAGMQNVSLTLKNTSGTAYNSGKIQSAPADSPELYVDEDTTALAAIADGAVAAKNLTGMSKAWFRVVVSVPTGGTAKGEAHFSAN